MKRVLAFIASGLVSTMASATGGAGLITGFIPGSGPFVFSTSVVNTPAVSCNTTGRFAIAVSDPRYQVTIAAILEAFATGTQVIVNGTGSCTVFPNAEDLSYICVGTIPC